MISMERNANPAEGGTFRVRYIVYAALAVLALMAVFSYSPEDAASLSGGSTRPPTNWIGYTGAWIVFWSFHLFGLATYMIVLLMVLRTIRRFLPARPLRFWKPFAGGVLATLGVMLLLALTPEPFAGNLLTCMTTLPLRLLTYFGLLAGMTGFLLGIYIIVRRLCPGGDEWTNTGVFTLFALSFFFTGIQMVGIGVIGEYIGRIYTDVRARPRYFIEEVVGRDDE